MKVGKSSAAAHAVAASDSEVVPLKRAARTRLALLNAGRSLFAEHAIKGVTIDEIVQAAGVAKGTFYTHFADRDDLERAITQEIRSAVERAVFAANLDVRDPASRIARAMCVYLRFAMDEREQATVLSRMHAGHEGLASPLNHGLIEDITAGLSENRLTVATVESGALFVLGVTQIGLLATLRQPSVSFAVTIAQQLCALLLRGFGLAPSEAESVAAQAADQIVRSSKAPPTGALR